MSDIKRELVPGDILIHTKTGNRYVYEGTCLAKFQDEWIDAISYTKESTDERFITSQIRLENAFTVV